MNDQQLKLEKSLSGAMIFTIAGAIWGAIGVYSMKGPEQKFLWIGLAIATLALLGAEFFLISIVNKGSAPLTPELAAREAKESRIFTIVNGVQGVAIFIAVQVWSNLHKPEFLIPTVAIIVGLHFLVLGPFFRSRSHTVIGITMCLMAITVMVVIPQGTASSRPDGMAPRGVALGIGNAVLLWATTLYRLVEAIRSIE